MSSIIDKIKRYQIRYSLLISFLVIIFLPTLNFICWGRCKLLFVPTLVAFIASGMAFFSVILSALANLLILFMYLNIIIFLIIKKISLSDKIKLLLLLISLIIYLIISYLIYIN